MVEKEEFFLQCVSTADLETHAVNDKAVDTARKALIEVIENMNSLLNKQETKINK